VSTLFRLYHHGMREVLTRIEGKALSADKTRSLSPAAIESIRATMDASLTRMTQRLNSQMVLLTISIAGGPFLGLLGTVIGVLIVFAAIAATGDVNINAIAPGTAAALVATVAGLAVAIPCLFGYNWLNTKIKEITADMRVFVDEFVTRIAETYT
jgi:biopolymer transport protein ExbB